MEESLVLVAVMFCILAAAAISRRIQGAILTLPMVYVARASCSTSGCWVLLARCWLSP